VQPLRYRLVFTSGEIERIEKGKIVETSVALVDGNNGQTVKDGPLASATVELVVVNAEFNQHDNEYNWSREDFERNIIKKAQQGNSSAIGDVDQSVKSIVSNGRFNLVRGAKLHSGSTIFSNSSNRKVRLGVMVVSPMEARVLEGLSNPFFVRGHDRPPRQNNIRHNSSNTQSKAYYFPYSMLNLSVVLYLKHCRLSLLVLLSVTIVRIYKHHTATAPKILQTYISYWNINEKCNFVKLLPKNVVFFTRTSHKKLVL
jgi:hypothetical protein